MQIYLVGGALRDRLLGLEVKDRDWVVVGARPEQLLARGYRPVGRDFPVFLHPHTHEEYALARTERKQGLGYHGFLVNADPSVTLEEDLSRRDLTINALAEDAQGRLLDPFGGLNDLQQGLLRAVSPAFAEDPLRVLRTARFAARLAHKGFRIEEQTQEMMRRLVAEGEMATLSPERSGLEMERALQTRHPQVFFQVLEAVGALQALWPDLAADWAQKTPEDQAQLAQAAACGWHPEALFALLLVGWTEEKIKALVVQLRRPKTYLQQALLLSRVQQHPGLSCQRTPEATLELFERLDAWRLQDLALCTLDLLHFQGQLQAVERTKNTLLACRALKADAWVAQGLRGAAVGQALRAERLALISNKEGFSTGLLHRASPQE